MCELDCNEEEGEAKSPKLQLAVNPTWKKKLNNYQGMQSLLTVTKMKEV